uniref:Claudin 34 n=1 Tax=Tetraodon nigroviridis TaxID=99883 RepID=H3C1M1_TETNG
DLSEFLGLVLGFLAWILIMITAGLNEWRLWQVDEVSVITSGVAWVGIWRACFYSQVLPQVENCWSIGISAPFAPPEIPAAQVLMMLAVVSGLAANVCGAVAMRLAYFSVKNRRNMRLLFLLAGSLYLLTGGVCLVPLLWNMSSVLKNNTIDFPPHFQLPSAPVGQQVGSAIGVGIFASLLTLLSGLLFLCYRYAWRSLRAEEPV